MRNSLWNDFRTYVLYSGNVLYKLVAINVAVFILFALVWVAQSLFTIPYDLEGIGKMWLSVPSEPLKAVISVWSFITYQFLHYNFLHLAMNMLIFLFAGRIFREFLGDKKLLSVYLIGGICGALVFIAAMQLFPMFRGTQPYLMGASASIMAVLAAVGTQLPSYQVRLMFIGSVKLVYIVIFLAVVDFLSLAGSNAGGHFAHIGGLAWGFIYIRSLQRGTDLGSWITNALDWIGRGGKSARRPLTSRSYENSSEKRPVPRSRISQAQVDTILDKIAKSGYESLSQREKDILFRASNEP